MKFIHAADIHLDSPLLGLSRRGAVPAHVVRDCTRRAFANLIDLAITEKVDFVLIAGDLYDGDWRDFSTGLFFAGEMRRLGAAVFPHPRQPRRRLRHHADPAATAQRAGVLVAPPGDGAAG